jgi:hypothetical protein
MSAIADQLGEQVQALQRQVYRTQRLIGVLGVVVTVLMLAAFRSAQQNRRFTEIDVERINVVEPDGRPALVIANTRLMPGPIWKGKELPKHLSQGRAGSAGLLFVDAQGNEVGGLAYRATVSDTGYAAHGILTFDQHNQDQVVGLHYFDRGTNRSAGLSVWDRSTRVSIGDVTALFEARRNATTTPARDSAQRRIDEIARSGGFGAHRVFIGSEDRTAGLRIMDTAGRERIRILVDSTSVARLEVLDENAKVIYSIPSRAP